MLALSMYSGAFGLALQKHADDVCQDTLQGFNMEDVLRRAQQCGASLDQEVCLPRDFI